MMITEEQRLERNRIAREWRKKNPERVRESQKRFLAKKRLGTIRELTPKQIERMNGIRKMSEHVTEKDLKAMRKGAIAYCCRSTRTVLIEDVLGDAYVGLANALRLYDENKNPNKGAYIYQKVRYHLLDMYRAKWGRTDSPKREFLTMMGSLNATAPGVEEGEYLDLLEGRSSPEELKMDALFFREKLKKVINSIPRKHKNKKNKINYFKIWEGYNVRGMTMTEIADENNISESRVSQLFKNVINPAFIQFKMDMAIEHSEYA